MTDYGSDCALTFEDDAVDIDPYFSEVTGPTAVAHSVVRGLMTPTGSMWWAPGEGYDVRVWLNESIDLKSAAVTYLIASEVKEEAERDERVRSATADVTFVPETKTLMIRLELETAEGKFVLVLEASALTVEILSLDAA